MTLGPRSAIAEDDPYKPQSYQYISYDHSSLRILCLLGKHPATASTSGSLSPPEGLQAAILI
ncbi:MAG: hypothetical protein ACFE94_05825 [Candidatus Hodarchaeota archaeon]